MRRVNFGHVAVHRTAAAGSDCVETVTEPPRPVTSVFVAYPLKLLWTSNRFRSQTMRSGGFSRASRYFWSYW